MSCYREMSGFNIKKKVISEKDHNYVTAQSIGIWIRWKAVNLGVQPLWSEKNSPSMYIHHTSSPPVLYGGTFFVVANFFEYGLGLFCDIL